MQVGDNFVIHMSENPSTGYTWNVASDFNNECGPEGSITYTSSYDRDSNPRGFTGVGGIRTFIFKVNEGAKPNSSCVIGFTLAHKWDLQTNWQNHPEKKFRMRI